MFQSPNRKIKFFIFSIKQSLLNRLEEQLQPVDIWHPSALCNKPLNRSLDLDFSSPLKLNFVYTPDAFPVTGKK